jgi:hypothetical protein
LSIFRYTRSTAPLSILYSSRHYHTHPRSVVVQFTGKVSIRKSNINSNWNLQILRFALISVTASPDQQRRSFVSATPLHFITTSHGKRSHAIPGTYSRTESSPAHLTYRGRWNKQCSWLYIQRGGSGDNHSKTLQRSPESSEPSSSSIVSPSFIRTSVADGQEQRREMG